MKFSLEQKVKVSVTHDLSNSIGNILKLKGYKKPFIVIDRFLLDMDIIKNLLQELKLNNIDFSIFDQVIPDPPIGLIDKGAELFNRNNCDSIIAIGGGSVIDASRGINIVRTHGGSVVDYVFEKNVPSFCPGLISVPTTSGTGSEISNAVVITDTEKNEKLTILSDNALSEYAVLCPELVVSLPVGQTIATGLDVFSHALEAYTSNLSTPVIDSICEKVMFLVVKYLPKAVRNGYDLEARERMMVAALLGGWVINNSGTHIGHSQAHVLGPKYNVPHGVACAYATPGTIQYTAITETEKIREVGNILGAELTSEMTKYEIGETVSNSYKYFRDKVLGLDPVDTLSISREELLENAETIVNERFAKNAPFEVTRNIVERLLEIFG